MQTRLPGDLVSALKAVIDEYAEETAVSQDSEESEEHQVVHAAVQHPNFPSEQLLQAVSKTVEVTHSPMPLLDNPCPCMILISWPHCNMHHFHA